MVVHPRVVAAPVQTARYVERLRSRALEEVLAMRMMYFLRDGEVDGRASVNAILRVGLYYGVLDLHCLKLLLNQLRSQLRSALLFL